MPRNTQLKRQLRIICRLLGSPNGLPAEGFEDIRLEEHITKKTLHRDLKALEAVPELGIVVLRVVNYQGTRRFWKLGPIGEVFKPTPYLPKTKRCRVCGEPKDIEQFYIMKSANDGRRSACTDCITAYSKKYRLAHKEQVLAQKRRWNRRNRIRLNQKRRLDYREQKLFRKPSKSV
jgi:hypothetical protein